MAQLLEMRGLTKRFGPVVANDDVSLTLDAGEIVGLLGENGAGKSTLVKMLFGIYAPDSGEIFFDGKPANISDPGDAIAQGIGMVHQHFQLVPPLTVAENIMLGAETVSKSGGGAALVAASIVDGPAAGDLIADAAKAIKGGGGKGADLAMAGGKDPDGVDAALDLARQAAGIS